RSGRFGRRTLVRFAKFPVAPPMTMARTLFAFARVGSTRCRLFGGLVPLLIALHCPIGVAMMMAVPGPALIDAPARPPDLDEFGLGRRCGSLDRGDSLRRLSGRGGSFGRNNGLSRRGLADRGKFG